MAPARCFTGAMEPHELGQPALLSLQPDDPVYRTLAELATAQACSALGKDVELDPEAVDRSGHWAFVRGRLRDAGGQSLSLDGTPFQDAAAAGAASDLAAVLFRQDEENQDEERQGEPAGWSIVDHTVLPTDVAWLDWPQKHGAPTRLLGVG